MGGGDGRHPAEEAGGPERQCKSTVRRHSARAGGQEPPDGQEVEEGGDGGQDGASGCDAGVDPEVGAEARRGLLPLRMSSEREGARRSPSVGGAFL
mmetsp:Transcript_37730/g.73885  ORF Transcript_37730/g.73885 Transcript_37730/m.73885 type:complete len:96 (-) Transcript_37730:141-428(-)|eukprot:CAMPEP_0194329046 /NCGR_PEP_ID=MMETSP0171-20130528/46824_1 /TAXON_ID=218684 /ORGANISM="Corethron pennatum, Strain L29A3" /LENGTH=95 /DNA_ID=CAMNT_0039089629 /DNA_START=1041 /DNA_END=1328 /DNA_ORIENTATION=+